MSNLYIVGSPKIPWPAYSKGMTLKATLRDRMPRIQGTGPNDKREKMTGKLKGRCSEGAFGGRRAS